jgi:hypothetical protein
MTGPATFRQKFALYRMTGVDWRNIEIEKSKASTVIGIIALYFSGKGNISLSRVESEVRSALPPGTPWDASMLKKPQGIDAPDSPPPSPQPVPKSDLRGFPERVETEEEPPQADLQEEPEDEEKTEVDSALEQLRLALEREAAQKIKGTEDGRGPVKLDPTDGAYIKPPIWDEAIALIGAGLNIFIPGPAGCGKSRMVAEAAKALELDLFTISFSGGLRYAQAFGSTHIHEGNSEWRPAPLLEAVQKPGIILLDEIWSADPEVSLGLNSLLEPDSRSILTPIGKIKVHEGCRFVAAANTVGRSVSRQYTGAQRADDSLLDRFMVIPMGYDLEVEASILKKLGVNGKVAGYLLESLGGLRRQIAEANTPFDASTRRLISAARAYLAGIPKERAFEIAFLNSLSKAERSRLAC